MTLKRSLREMITAGRRLWTGLILAGLLGTGMAQAQNSQLAFTLNSFSNASNNAFYIGFEFSVTSTKTVNQLGVLNTNNHATLPGNTAVGIYSVTPGGIVSKPATVVIAAIVPAGTTPISAGARGAFMVNVTPTVLAPGNYVLLAETGGTHEGYGTAPLAFQAGISYVNGWFAGGGSGGFPGLTGNTTLTNQSNGGNNWISAVFGVVPPPAGTTLDFSSASSGSIAD